MDGGMVAGVALLVFCASCGAADSRGGATVPNHVADAQIGTVSDASISGVTSPVRSVIVIAMENENGAQIYDDDTDAPYIDGTLIPTYARATSFLDELPSGIPSEPHYVWLEAGTNAFADHTFTSDSAPSASNSTSSTAHLATQIAAAGLSWGAYEEGITPQTGSCPIASSGFYAPKHDPFVFFQDVSGNPPSKTNAGCAAYVKDLSALPADLSAGALSRYTFVSPNLCHDMHGASGCPDSNRLEAGDTWLAGTLPPILAYANAHDTAVFVVWDEGDPSGHISFFALGPQAKTGYAGPVGYNHSSVLKSVEEILGLPILPTVAGATDLADLFVPGSFPPGSP